MQAEKDMQQVMADLRRRYTEQLPAKVQEVEERWAAAEGLSDPDNLRVIHQIVHQIHGSSGTFGLAEISGHTQTPDLFLKKLIETRRIPTKEEVSRVGRQLHSLRQLVREALRNASVVDFGTHGTNGLTVEKRARVLLADDASFLRKRIAIALGNAGYEVEEVDNGLKAVRHAQEHRPDLILMDVMMPVMDGLEATRLIREHETLKGIPIIMLTTKSALQDVHKALVIGISDYITKPCTPHHVVERVQACLKV